MTYSANPGFMQTRRLTSRRSTLPQLWTKYATIGLIILVLIGYPVVGIIVAYMDLDSRIISTPYRIFVMVYSVILFLSGWFSTRKIKLNALVTVFFAAYAARLLSDVYIYQLDGAQDVFAFYVATVVVPTIAISANEITPDSDKLVARGLIAVGFPLLLLVLGAERAGLAYNPWANEGATNSRLGFEALNPISLGYAAVVTLLAGLANLTVYRGRLIWIVISCISIILGGIILLAAGSRGPLVALAVCVLWFGISKVSRFAYLAPAILLLMIGGLSQAYVFQRTLDTATGGWAQDGSSLERLEFQRAAVQDFLQSPIIGLHYQSIDIGWGSSPHNMTLETAMAMGVLGLALFFGMLFKAGRNVLRFFNTQYPLLSLLLLTQIVNSQLSGAIWGSDAFFVLLVLALQPKKVRRSAPNRLPVREESRALRDQSQRDPRITQA